MTTIHTTLLAAFDSAVEKNKNVADIDQATVQAGRAIADAIDKITADPHATPTEKTKALYLTPHLISILKELLATPLSRKMVGLAVGEKKEASRLELIQAQAQEAAKVH